MPPTTRKTAAQKRAEEAAAEAEAALAAEVDAAHAAAAEEAKVKPGIPSFDYAETSEDDTPDLDELEFYLPGEQVGGKEYHARKPKDAVFARAAAAASARVPAHLRVAAVLEFFDAALVPADRARFRMRFEDEDDALDVKDVVPVILWMANEWRSQLPQGNRADRRAAGRR